MDERDSYPAISCFLSISSCFRPRPLQYTSVLRLLQSVTLFILWLAPQKGKMNQIQLCNWLPARETVLLVRDYWHLLAINRLPLYPLCRKIGLVMPYNKSFIDQAWSDQSRTSFWTETRSRSKKTF